MKPSLHPAQYSDELLPHIKAMLIAHWGGWQADRFHSMMLLDPFAGLGIKMAALAREIGGVHFTGVEIEPGYAKGGVASPYVVRGDSRNLKAVPGIGHFVRFDGAVTSPVYPNGMADNFHQSDSDKSIRRTYVHGLRSVYGKDYELQPGNAAGTNPRRNPHGMLRFHDINEAVYDSVFEVLRPGAPFIVNVKDTPYMPDFASFTQKMLRCCGFEVKPQTCVVECPGSNFGANQHSGVKAPYEHLILARRPL
jgi:hypothetical protein